MATFRKSECQDGDEVLRCQGIKRQNLNARKSTSRRIQTGILSTPSENSELKPNLGSKLWRAWNSPIDGVKPG